MWVPRKPANASAAAFLCAVLCTNCQLTWSFLHVCYYTGPSPKLKVEDLDPDLCTHVILGFGRVKGDVVDLSTLGGLEAVEDFSRLRTRAPQLQLMLSLGGDAGFKRMVARPSSISRFTESVIELLRSTDMDGIDLDWEFPNYTDSRRFTNLLKAMNEAFKNESETIGRERLLLSIAAPAPLTLIKGIYNIPAIANYTDFVNLMTYDMNLYQWYFPFTGHNSPLFSRPTESFYFNTLNMKYSAEYWTWAGLPKQKLMVGVPTYGLVWKLYDSNKTHVGAPSTGRGEHGGGYINLAETCMFLDDGGRRVFDDDSKVPYAYKNYTWISYDDEESVALKADWITSNNFGGIMTFSLNADDWQGVCGNGTFPLHRTIVRTVYGGISHGLRTKGAFRYPVSHSLCGAELKRAGRLPLLADAATKLSRGSNV